MQDIYIEDIGSGFPLVLVHGYLGSSEMWNLQKEYLSKHGLKIKTKLFKNCDHKIPVEGSSLGLGFLRKNLL